MMYKLLLGLLLSLCVVWGGYYVVSGLPKADSLNDLKLISATQVYDINGELISKLFEQNRIVVSKSNMSPYLAAAIIANEDTRFYRHVGIDPIGIARAMLVNLRTGSIAQGGSTITQQLAREMFLNQERSLTRKVREAILAIILDMRFSKSEILEAYLNQVYLGEGAYGVEAASQKYFGKPASTLTIAESAMIAGLARGPVLYSPYRDMNSALKRRAVVLNSMYEQGAISEAEKDAANQEPMRLMEKKERAVKASYFIDYIAQLLVDRYGEETVYQRGLKVYTTLDLNVQKEAENVLGLYQGAVISIDPRSGYIKAMVGGNNYKESQRNRAVAELRQPGSAFKPFVYAVALNQGMRSNTVIVDEPVDIAGYQPLNYNKKNQGPMTLKKALRWSVNTVAVKLGQQVGMGEVLKLAKSLGITTLTEKDRNLATALGGVTDGVSLLELSGAYSAFANGGIVSSPMAILRVEDEHNRVLDRYETNQHAVLSPEVAYIMTDMLMGTIQGGTATGANIGREAAGKTGTTDRYETAWFIGYTPELLTGIYIGNDNRTSIDLSGTQVAQLWGKFMASALKGKKEERFAVPDNIVKGIKICAKTGQIADDDCDDVEYNAFIKGTEPKPKSFVQKIKDKVMPDAGGKHREDSQWKKWMDKIPRLPGF